MKYIAEILYLVLVTHLYEFAHNVYRKRIGIPFFLRAERGIDGRRTFKLIEGEPLQTSYGEDLYRRIFGTDNTNLDGEIPSGLAWKTRHSSF
ncbi:MAG: hypothetical protein ACPL4K_05545 [Candidatus Margulisiibacteriota bacterium]